MFQCGFCEQNTLRVPLAVVSATNLPTTKDEEQGNSLLRWLGVGNKGNGESVQHWAAIVRNMLKRSRLATLVCWRYGLLVEQNFPLK